MAWAETASLTGGAWRTWTPAFNNGTDLFDATNMTLNSCRWVCAEGTVYAKGSFTLAAGTNYGNGTNPWILWLPSEVPAYADGDNGSRHIGGGYVYDNRSDPFPHGARLTMYVVNSFEGFYAFNMERYVATGGNWNGGITSSTAFDRSNLSSLAGGTRPLYVNWYMRYIAKSTYSG